jgi:hypothetical protein
LIDKAAFHPVEMRNVSEAILQFWLQGVKPVAEKNSETNILVLSQGLP